MEFQVILDPMLNVPISVSLFLFVYVDCNFKSVAHCGSLSKNETGDLIDYFRLFFNAHVGIPYSQFDLSHSIIKLLRQILDLGAGIKNESIWFYWVVSLSWNHRLGVVNVDIQGLAGLIFALFTVRMEIPSLLKLGEIALIKKNCPLLLNLRKLPQFLLFSVGLAQLFMIGKELYLKENYGLLDILG